MPLKCLSPDGVIYSFDYSREQFEVLRKEHAARNHLHFDCCNSGLGLRISSRGLPHFFHQKLAGACRYETESEEHLRLKECVAVAARDAGWNADTEAHGATFDGAEDWVADVLASKGQIRIAIEIQRSGQTWADTCDRQDRYRASMVRGLWFFKSRNYDVTERVPAFQYRTTDTPDGFEIRLSPPSNPRVPGVRAIPQEWIPVKDFIKGALRGYLKWAPLTKTGEISVLMRVKNPTRCECGLNLWLPVGCAVTPPFANHHSLVWTLMSRSLRTVGFKWLNAIVDQLNNREILSEGELLAHRIRLDRYTCNYVCPSCGHHLPDVRDGHPEKTFQVEHIPLELLGAALPASPEWTLTNRWWLMSSADDRAAWAGSSP
jgi:hypothetical protein